MFRGLFPCKEHLAKTEKLWEETQEADGSEEYSTPETPQGCRSMYTLSYTRVSVEEDIGGCEGKHRNQD